MRLLFYSFSDEKELLTGCPPVQDVVNMNKMKFEPCGNLVDQAFSQFIENLINNQDPQSQIENDENQG